MDKSQRVNCANVIILKRLHGKQCVGLTFVRHEVEYDILQGTDLTVGLERKMPPTPSAIATND